MPAAIPERVEARVVGLKHHQRYWLLHALFNLVVMLPMAVSTVFLLQAGWDYVGIGVVWSIILGTSALAGGPAGWMADHHGRKTMVMAGCIFMCMAMGGWALNPHWGYLWAVLQGLGTPAVTGPLQAWAVDELPAKSKYDSRALLAQGATWGRLGALLGSLVVLAAGIQDYRLIYWGASAVAAALTLMCLGLIKETPIPVARQSQRGRPPWSVQLGLITGYLVLLFLCYSLYMFLWQPELLARGLQPHQLPITNGLFSLAAAASTYGLSRIRSQRGFTLASCLFPATAALGFFLASRDSTLSHAFVGYLLFNAAYFSALVVGQILLNRAAETAWRATTLGTSMSLALAVNAVAQPLLGALVAQSGPVFAARLASCLCLSLLPLIFAVSRGPARHELPAS